MTITINGNGTVTGVSVGGLPNGIVDTDMLAASAVTAPKRGAGAILQVVQGIKKDTSSNSTSAGYWYNTDVTLSITPSHANNKILITGYVSVGVAGPQHNIGCGIHKAVTLIDNLGDAAGSRIIRNTVVEYDTNDCSDGTIAGALLGGGLAGFGSRGKDRWWAIPSGIIGGAMVGCAIDGG